jgi:anti-sigma regulatory factor (Ser/Thr protein kinase)
MRGSRIGNSMTVLALPERVGAVRVFVKEVLGPTHSCLDVAVLLASELVTNSVRHSGSAVPGGRVTVTVWVAGDGARVEVNDRSGSSVPMLLLPAADGETEGSRGIQLVDALAARWGYERSGGQSMAWFEVRDGSTAAAASLKSSGSSIRFGPQWRAPRSKQQVRHSHRTSQPG